MKITFQSDNKAIFATNIFTQCLRISISSGYFKHQWICRNPVEGK